MKMPGFIKNALSTISRREMFAKLFGICRDVDSECGHPLAIQQQDYDLLWARGDMANRVVCLYPEESWSEPPEVYETEDEEKTAFEMALDEMLKEIPLWTYLQRADILSGVGRYGILLLGFDDGLELSQPVAGVDEKDSPLPPPAKRPVKNALSNEEEETEPPVPTTELEKPKRKLLYVRPLEERIVKITALEADVRNPRFGLPKTYQLTFMDTDENAPIGSDGKIPNGTLTVHWSRVIHLADNRTNNEVYGTPRMKKVFNRLLDLKKIVGGSGEMFWKGGFPGISLESNVGAEEDIEFDAEGAKKQLRDYMEGLQRYIATVGMQAKSLTVQVADPLPHLNAQIQLIAAAMAVPVRVLMGSERGELASSQDMVTWNKRLNKRRVDYINPFMLKPLLDRLIKVGVLPQPGAEGYIIDWVDLNTPSPTDKANTAQKISDAMAKYVQSGSDVLMPPFHFLTLVVGLDKGEAESVIEAAEKQIDDDDGLLDGLREDELKAAQAAKVAAETAQVGKPKPVAPTAK